MINIVFSTDQNYIVHCATAMASVIDSATSRCRFYILTDGLSKEATDLLCHVTQGRDAEVNIVHIDEQLFDSLPVWGEGHMLAHISRATYYRLCLPELLPGVDKAIYLDCDLIVRSPLDELWNTDISGYALAAVHQISDLNRNQPLGIPQEEGYFNAGVLLFNLRYWREHQVQQQLFDWAQKNHEKILYHDQDILNAVLHDQTFPLSYRWNMTFEYFGASARYLAAHATGRAQQLHQECLVHHAEWQKHPGIIHFAAEVKPWHNRCMHPRKYDYYKYRQVIGQPMQEPVRDHIEWKLRELLRQLGLGKALAWMRYGRQLMLVLVLLLSCTLHTDAQSVLEGKRVLWLGTSVPSIASYPTRSCAALGMSSLNRAVGASFACIRVHHPVLYEYSGYSLSMTRAEKEERYRPYVEDGTITEHQLDVWKYTSYETLVFDYIDTTDVIIFDHGLNDYDRTLKQEYEAGEDAVDWNSEDRYTFIGAFNYLYRRIKQRNPDVIIAIGGYFQNNCSVKPHGKAVAEVSKWIARHYNLPLIDAWNYTNIPDGYAPNSSTWLDEFNTRFGTHYQKLEPDSLGNITYFQQFAPDGSHPSSDLSRHSDRVLDTIFTQLLEERLTPLFAPKPAIPVINELMQGNVDGVMEDNDFPDSWVELYNPSDTAIDLKQYRLSIERDTLQAYALPDTTRLAPHGYKLIYCDKVAQGLHTPFRLDSGRDTVYLWGPDGTIIDSLSHPKMPAPGIAYGRWHDGSEHAAHQVTATPGAQNCGICDSLLLPEPVFSHPSQLFDQQFQLTISMPEEDYPSGAQIYWTTDGSEPNQTSRHGRSVQLTIGQSTVLKAKIMAQRGLQRPATVRSYLKPDHEHELPVVSLVTDSRYIDDPQLGIFYGSSSDPHANFMQKWRRPVFVEWLNTDSTDIAQLCEMAIGGATSRTFPQKSLKLYAKKYFGKKYFKGTLWSDKPQVSQVRSLMLRNGGSRCPGSRINDAFCQRLFGSHLDNLDWQAYEPVVVYLNGEYQGIYELRERSDEDYVESNHHLEDEEIWTTGNIYRGPDAYNRLVSAIWKNSNTYEQTAYYFDMEEFVNYLCAEIYCANTDWPDNNYSAWASREGENRWRWILKDLDQLRYYPDSANFINRILLMGAEGADEVNKGKSNVYKIFTSLNRYPEFQQQLIDHLTIYLGDFLNPSTALPMLQTMRRQIEPEMAATFAVLRRGVEWAEYELDELEAYVSRRASQLYHNLAETYELGEVIPTQVIDEYNLPWRMNGMRTSDDSFNGAVFLYHGVWLDSGDDQYCWRVIRILNDGATEEKDVQQREFLFKPDHFYTPDTEAFLLLPIPFDESALETVHPDQTMPLPSFDLLGRKSTATTPGILINKTLGSKKALLNADK